MLIWTCEKERFFSGSHNNKQKQNINLSIKEMKTNQVLNDYNLKYLKISFN